ncbi:GTPase IMAP family member 4-like isoform X1 [Salarias fasciatus]|uniref:GTPase IMAP family member 4-like isoform X1 n=2 Tax=Salarias fasciatus TaxID=181472 RepID=UPI0011766C95|nr:GTPase IMAP family member 4-like isoform X1 [Salarias fasciatus]XP_029944071.1 GTPase IMAP family member 4-like isoform X1 [Salarias fasciatus]
MTTEKARCLLDLHRFFFRTKWKTAASKNKIKITNSPQLTKQIRTRGKVRKFTIKMSSQPTSRLAPIPLSDRREATPLRVVLLGKTGTGKSKFGNALIEENVFKVNSSANSGTGKCQAATKRNGELIVVDTPGFFDTSRDEANLIPDIGKSITECSPGPHAFLIFLKVEKYTEHEKQIITKIRKLFSEEAFKYAVLVFTHGDDLGEGETIQEFVSENEDLKELSDKCGGRCHVVDNKYWEKTPPEQYRNNQFQIKQLFSTINEMVEQNGGGCYTNKFLQTVERIIREETKRTGSREKAKESFLEFFIKKAVAFVLKVLLGVFLGGTAGASFEAAFTDFREAGHGRSGGYERFPTDSHEEDEGSTTETMCESLNRQRKPKAQ